MRRLVLILGLWALSLWNPVAAAERAPAMRRTTIAGQEYVHVGDWAAARSLKLYWPPRSEEAMLSNRWVRLYLRVNSRVVTIQGVTAVMSLPASVQRDALYISQFDLRALIHPILYPSRPDKPKPIRVIALDAGHGGKDPGNQAHGEQEKKHTLLLAKEIQRRLQAAGLKVVMTRTTDTALELQDRSAYAKKRKADIFLSLHYNSVPGGNGSVHGAEVYALTPANAVSTNDQGDSHHGHPSLRAQYPGNKNDEQNVLLGYLLQKNLASSAGLADRGLKRARWTVLCYAEMPGALIEAGFMSHPNEGKRITTSAYRRQVAIAVVDAVLAYKRNVERPLPSAPAKTTTKSKPAAGKGRR